MIRAIEKCKDWNIEEMPLAKWPLSIRGPGQLLKVHCPLQPIVTVTWVLECSLRRAQKAQRRRKKRTEVGFSGWAVPPRGGGRKAQWVRRAIKTPFTLVTGKVNLFLGLFWPPVLGPSPPELRWYPIPLSSHLWEHLKVGPNCPRVLVQSGHPGGACDRHPSPTKEVGWALQGSVSARRGVGAPASHPVSLSSGLLWAASTRPWTSAWPPWTSSSPTSSQKHSATSSPGEA